MVRSVLACVTTAAALLLAASPAYADADNDFLGYLKSRYGLGPGEGATDLGADNLIAQGHRVCSDLHGGSNPAAESTSLVHALSIPQAQADEFVAAAVVNLCPDAGGH
jgi:hypothetical protein